jgi:hypothetical protein
MENGVDGIAAQELNHEVMVADVALNELGLIRHSPTEPGRQIIENAHVFSGIEQLQRHMAADEPSSPGDQNSHAADPQPRCGCYSPFSIGKRLKDF